MQGITYITKQGADSLLRPPLYNEEWIMLNTNFRKASKHLLLSPYSVNHPFHCSPKNLLMYTYKIVYKVKVVLDMRMYKLSFMMQCT